MRLWKVAAISCVAGAVGAYTTTSNRAAVVVGCALLWALVTACVMVLAARRSSDVPLLNEARRRHREEDAPDVRFPGDVFDHQNHPLPGSYDRY